MQFDVSIDVKSITTQNGYSGNINFTGSAADTIRVRGNVTLGGTGDFECSSGTTLIEGNLSFGAGETFRGNNGTVTILGNVIQTGGTANGLGGGTLTVGGNLSVSGGAFNGGNGIIIISGDLGISSGGTFRASDSTTQLAGAFSNTGGTFTSNGWSLRVHLEDEPDTHVRRLGVQEDVLQRRDGRLLEPRRERRQQHHRQLGLHEHRVVHGDDLGTASPPALAFNDTSYGTFNGTQQPDRAHGLAAARRERGAVDRRLGEHQRASRQRELAAIVSLTGTSSAVKLGLSPTNLHVLRNDGTALITTTAPSSGTWHHVAYTWNGTSNNALRRRCRGDARPARRTTARR